MITHIVFFKLKERTDSKVEEALGILRGLDGQVPSLRSLEVGADVIQKERSYDLALTATFDDLDGLEEYRVHPEHIKVATYIKEASSEIASVDYES